MDPRDGGYHEASGRGGVWGVETLPKGIQQDSSLRDAVMGNKIKTRVCLMESFNDGERLDNRHISLHKIVVVSN